MRILFCNKYSFPFSGTEVYLFELMNLLRAKGHEVALFSMADSRAEPGPYDNWFVPHIDFKDPSHGLWTRLKLGGHAIHSTEARRRLRGLLRQFRPDVAHVRNIYHHLSPSILWELKAQGIPVVYHLNDFKILCPTYNLVAHGRTCQSPCTAQYWKLLTRKCHAGPLAGSIMLLTEAYIHHYLGTYRKCVDHFLTPSEFARDLLVQHGFDPAKITVLPHFQDLPAKTTPVKPDSPVLYFGRLSPEKGVSDLLQAMQPLPQVRLKLAGSGPERTRLEQRSRDLDLSNVEFTGQLQGDALSQAITQSCFTVLPSHAYETLGKSILESYAQGRAVVASDLGSRRELVRPHETGLLFEAGNIPQLTEAISFLIQRPKLAEAMGAAGRDRVRTHHNPEHHYQHLMDLYERVRSNHRPPRKSRPVRVAFIGGRGVVSKYSGIEAYYEEVGEHLARMGHAVTIYCRSYFTPDLGTYRGMRLVRIPTIRSKHLETVVHTVLSTLHAMGSDYDIVHYHALGPALFSFLPRLVGKKTVVTVQGLDWQRKKWGPLASWILRIGETAAVRLPNATMVVSRTLQEHFRSRHEAETVYVPNGTQLREKQRGRCLERWNLNPDDYVLFLGRFSPEKNCHLLIDAYQRIETSSQLVLAGGSSHTDSYMESLRQRKTERTHFLDWVSGEALNELLTHAAIFVLPSDLEGLSLALLDAMGAGVCVLTSDIPENREVVDGAGFTFRAGDVADLARMLQLLLANPQMRAEAGNRARQRMQELYLWPRITGQIAQVYEGLLGDGRRRQPTKANFEEPRQSRVA